MSSTSATSTDSQDPAKIPLKVIIAGAGIGGLFAAIALRRAGHTVEVYEASAFAMELGAAIHLPPNVVGVLLRFGLDPATWRANLAEHLTVFDKKGEVISTQAVGNISDIYSHSWRMSHRVDLHEAFKRAATSNDGPGTPVKINLRSRVVSCDTQQPSISLQDGRVIEGDLLIGADGTHSTLRATVMGETVPAEPTGGSAFRFLVDMAKIKNDPLTASLVQRPGEFQMWEGTHRRLIIYPCRDNTELNFAAFHPDRESPGSAEGWNNAASVEHMLAVFDEFPASMKALLGKADPATLKLWRLYDRPDLKTWIAGRTALLGDAAHPFLPHQGQGGAQAIEDGAALGALFPLGTRKGEIPHRLELYMQSRYDRATLVQNFTRQMAFKTSKDDKVGGFSLDPMEFAKINFSHDAYDHAEKILHKQM